MSSLSPVHSMWYKVSPALIGEVAFPPPLKMFKWVPKAHSSMVAHLVNDDRNPVAMNKLIVGDIRSSVVRIDYFDWCIKLNVFDIIWDISGLNFRAMKPMGFQWRPTFDIEIDGWLLWFKSILSSTVLTSRLPLPPNNKQQNETPFTRVYFKNFIKLQTVHIKGIYTF